MRFFSLRGMTAVMKQLSFLFQKLLADKKGFIYSHFVTARIGRMISLARSVADSLFSRFDETLSTRATLSVHR